MSLLEVKMIEGAFGESSNEVAAALAASSVSSQYNQETDLGFGLERATPLAKPSAR